MLISVRRTYLPDERMDPLVYRSLTPNHYLIGS